MRGQYKRLDDGAVVECTDLMEWGQWMQNANRTVAADELPSGVRISTVFLGLDHAFGGGPPVLWETMIFGGPHDQDQWRYTSESEAVAGHEAAVALARGTDN